MTNDQNYHDILQSRSYINEIGLKVKTKCVFSSFIW